MRREVEKLKGVIRHQVSKISGLELSLARAEMKSSRLLTESKQNGHELEVVHAIEPHWPILADNLVIRNSGQSRRPYLQALKSSGGYMERHRIP